MRFTREEYIAIMQHQDIGKPMFIETMGLLLGLDEEWRAQGATPSQIDLTAYDFDYVAHVPLSVNTDYFGEVRNTVLEDTPEYKIYIDHLGRHMKLSKKAATLALPMDYPVKTMDDWLKIKHHYTFCEERINKEQLQKAKELQQQGYLTVASIPGGFDFPRQLMGEENLCYAYYDEPELIEDMMETVSETACRCLDIVSDIVPIDNLAIHEDMAGKGGSLIGPNIILQYIQPYYRKTIDMLRSKGLSIVSQDSDGNMTNVLDAFLECGVTCTVPCEPAAGMDIVTLREKYGERLSFKGGIDKHVLRKSKEEIVKELEYKMQKHMWTGTVFGLDHRIPNGTPLENYIFYVNTAREILGKPPLEKDKQYVWQRVSF